MKLNAAKICIDCDTVFDGKQNLACPVCADERGVVWLHKWLRPRTALVRLREPVGVSYFSDRTWGTLPKGALVRIVEE